MRLRSNAGSSAAEILAGVKARVGVEKEDTPYAPQLVTWLKPGALEGTGPVPQ